MKRNMRFKNWYPDNLWEIKSYIPAVRSKKDVLAMIVPHAGWIYSGKTAGIVYASANVCDTYIIFCPSHTGLGAEVAVYPSGAWETPLGDMEVDSGLAKQIIKNSKFAEADFTAHIMEHSIEVQLPFIKALNPNAKIVPICLMTHDYDRCSDIAGAVYAAVNELHGVKTAVVASTDMSHYSNASIAKICDDMAIYQILSLDPKGLLDTVEEKNISMCGVVPTAASVMYSKLKGAKKSELLRYSNSGEVTGDFTEVVGYAGMIVY